MLPYYFVTYRLDIVLLCALTAYGLWHCRRAAKRSRPAAQYLPKLLYAGAAAMVLAGALLAEFAARRQRNFLVSVFAGFGPTYARELQRAGHADISLQTPSSDATYKRLLAMQAEWLRLNPLIADIYTVTRDASGRIRFLVDSQTDYDRNGRIEGTREQPTAIGEEYREVTPAFEEAFAGRALFDPEIVADRWGVWVSSFTPMFNDRGHVHAVLGIDYPARDWLRAIALRRGFVLLTVFFLIGLLLTSVTLITLMRGEIAERAMAQRELQSAKEAADAASRAKGEFLAVMSHEIRTPLTAITGYASMLEDTSLDPVQKRYVDTLRRGATTLVDLLNNILDFSRLEDGNLHLESYPAHPAEVITEVVDLLSNQATEKGLVLRFDNQLDPGLVVATDHARLRQIVMNLVGNAVKFTARGQVVVTARWDADGPAEGRLHIGVADTGPGIPADKLSGLFRMYAQADAATARRHGGSGLGLAISKRLIGRMAGEINVRSEVGSGSEFSIVLPCARSVAVPSSASPTLPISVVCEPTQSPSANNRLLVVDDNPTNCEVLKAMLNRTGYEIDVVHDGPAAIALAKQNRYGAILMDLAMPGMDGITATREIRSTEGQSRTPIIAVTAATSANDRRRCEDAGMDEFVPKPIDRKLLLEILRRFAIPA